MRTIVTLPQTSNLPAAPRVARSPLGQALVSPGQDWRLLLDPDYSPGGVPLNRAQQSVAVGVSNPLPFGLFTNGARAFDLAANYQVQPNIAFPIQEFTAFWVTELSSAIAGQFARSTTGESSGVRSLRLSFNSSGVSFVVYDGADAGTIAAAPGSPNWIDETAYFMVTFSPQSGTKLYANGVLADDEPTETDVIEAGFGAGQWQMLNAMRGKVGLCGILANDLSATEHADGRAKIDAYILDHYGIGA